MHDVRPVKIIVCSPKVPEHDMMLLMKVSGEVFKHMISGCMCHMDRVCRYARC